jgi:hypothetical protein
VVSYGSGKETEVASFSTEKLITDHWQLITVQGRKLNG